MANIYWKTKAWLLRASTPKTHEVPRMGSSTATAFAVNLKEKWRWPLRGAGRRGGGGSRALASRREASEREQTQPCWGPDLSSILQVTSG